MNKENNIDSMAHYLKDKRNFKALQYHMSFNSKVNFSNHEKEILLHLVEEYRDVIESKRNDAPIIEMKRNCWVTITRKFNSNLGISTRTTTQLKALWKNLKAKAKRDVWRVRSELGNLPPSAGENIEENIGDTSQNPLNMPTLSQRVCDILTQPAKDISFNFNDSNSFNDSQQFDEDKSGVAVDYSQNGGGAVHDQSSSVGGMDEVGLEFFDDQYLDDASERDYQLVAEKPLTNGDDMGSFMIKDEPKEDEDMMIVEDPNPSKEAPTPPLMIKPLPMLTKQPPTKRSRKSGPTLRHSPSYFDRTSSNSSVKNVPLMRQSPSYFDKSYSASSLNSSLVQSDLHINNVESLSLPVLPPSSGVINLDTSKQQNKNTTVNSGQGFEDKSMAPGDSYFKCTPVTVSNKAKNSSNSDSGQHEKVVQSVCSVEERNYHSNMLKMAEVQHEQKMKNLKIKEQILLLQKRKLEYELTSISVSSEETNKVKPQVQDSCKNDCTVEKSDSESKDVAPEDIEKTNVENGS